MKTKRALPPVGTKLVLEINYTPVDSIVLAYFPKSSKKPLTDDLSSAASVQLRLLALPISEDRTIETETTLTVKNFRDMIRSDKNKTKEMEERNAQSSQGSGLGMAVAETVDDDEDLVFEPVDERDGTQ